MLNRESKRNGSFHALTQSICPECRKSILAKIILYPNKVVLRKRCIEHGRFDAIISTDPNYWQKSLNFHKPGLNPIRWGSEVKKGCPEDCGLCPDHEQHTCTPVIEISNRCDLKCPVCIVWNKNSYDMTFEEFKSCVDSLIQKEGKLDVLFLSGGEPTLHKEFFKFVEFAKSTSKINRIIVSSHGGRIAKDEDFAKRFKELDLTLSLQFDSLKEETYFKLRGKDLLKEKKATLDVCSELKIPTIFTITLTKDINEDEIGLVVSFALSQPYVISATIQPIAYTGAGGGSFTHDPMRKITQSDVHKLLEKQLDWITPDDFVPIPCSHPSCYTVTHIFKLSNGKYIPLKRFIKTASYLDMLTNRGIIDARNADTEVLKDTINRVWTKGDKLVEDPETLLKDLKVMLKDYQLYGNPNKGNMKNDENVKAIYIHGFMDEHDFDLSRVVKCCFHYILPDGRTMPGCSYNNIHRFRDKRLN